MATSAIRRKPIHTYKSPSFNGPSDQLSFTVPRAIPRATSSSPQSDQSITEVTRTVILPYTNTPAKYRQPTTLPLYHPLGPLALSLPQLDPALFGLPNRISVDDAADDPIDDGRRSSSRARRPAAKVRERERDGVDEEDAMATPAPAASAQSTTREAGTRAPGSPRKRRAGGSGGTRRKRKAEAEEVDGAYPPPAKRTRNPRGAGNVTPVVASPLVSDTIVAAVEEAPAQEADALPSPETEEMQPEQPIAPPPKRTRTRKARAPVTKRRNSSASASTSTSVSVSIAANTRTTRAKAARESASDGDAEKKAGEEGKGAQEQEQEQEQEQADVEGVAHTTPLGEPVDEELKLEVDQGEEKMPLDAPSATLEPSAVLPPVALPASEKDEKEEGELSDEH